MSAPRGPWLSALWTLLLLAAAAPAPAQFLDDARQSIGFFPDPIERSPRLLGMGRLTLADDYYNRVSLWDFARNPIGIWEADTVSEALVTPALESATAGQNLDFGPNPRERQTLGAHGARVGFELFHRSRSGTAYGAYGRFDGISVDRPYASSLGLQRNVLSPSAVVVLTGRLPYLAPDRMRWALRGTFVHEEVENRYHLIIDNPSGQYVGLPGDATSPPDFFTPEEYRVNSTGVGGALAYRFGPWLTVTGGVDALETEIKGENSSVRHFSGTGESRPYMIGQTSWLGRVGPYFDWIVDARGWRASNEERWVFTLAAGIQQAPLTGRGFKLQRREEGSALRSRARLALGALTLGAGLETRYGKVEITGPRPDDITSFNYFLNTVSYRQNADSLVLPDSVRSDQGEQRDVGYSAGATLELPWRASRLGAEVHAVRRRHLQRTTGAGPEAKAWDVRAGLEVPCTAAFVGRAGYIYRSEDQDELTARNEYISHTVTAGAGIAHRGARWRLEAAYAHEWIQPDFADPFEIRARRQQFALQMRWAF